MPTIAGTLRSTARRVPDAEALQFGDRLLSYRELDLEVDRYATALRDLGVVQGDRVCLMSGNSDLFVLAFYAVQRLGAVLVPVNPASAPPEVAHLVDDASASVLLVAAALTERVPADCPATTLEDLAASAATASPYGDDVEVLESDDALILYTSGTTGKPKGALFDHHRTLTVATSMIGSLGQRAGDRFLHVAPLYHAAELAIMLVPGTLLGAKHVVLPGFDPAAVLDVMERERITMFFGVPTMFQVMMRVPGARPGSVLVAHGSVRRGADAGPRGRADGADLAGGRVHAALRPDRGRAERHLLHPRAGRRPPRCQWPAGRHIH